MRLLVVLLLSGGVVFAQQPNFVVIVADDLGVDLVGAYEAAASPPCTPNLDQLAREGLLFRNAWSNPSCSPTRAQIMTGLHASRSGVGQIVRDEEDGHGLTIPAVTLPRALGELGYATSAIGKWHLADLHQGALHPNETGFDYFAGSLFNLSAGRGRRATYVDWDRTVQGVTERSETYATRMTTKDAIARATAMEPPWLLYVAYNAPHAPLHLPRQRYCDATCSLSFCAAGLTTDAALAKAMVEALDQQVGRLVRRIDELDPEAIIIFLGDNGTAREAIEPPFDPARGKNTMYEGGVRVPMIVRGPGVPIGETAALVSAVDLPATLVELAGGVLTTPDSVSFAGVLADPGASERATVQAESFQDNFDPAVSTRSDAKYERAIRDVRYKLIRTLEDGVTRLELFDLEADPFELEDLYPPASAAALEAFERLTAALVGAEMAPGADIDGDGRIWLSDLARALGGFGGPAPQHADGDANLDGVVDLADLLEVLSRFGAAG